ncbi:MAG TPA: PaaI family thioesterase [Gaiellaceae bacterium]
MSLASLQRVLAGEHDPAPVASLIGFRLTAVEAGKVTVELEAGPQHTSPPGTLHGGVLCDIADAAMGMALFSLLDDAETFATVELKINFLKPVWTATLTAVGTVIKQGRTISLCECRVTDGGGSLVAYATCTQMTLRE